MRTFKKIVTLGLAAMMAVSAMSVSAFAAENNDTGESGIVEAEYGTVDSLDSFGEISYTIDEEGAISPKTFGISVFGISNPPSTLNPTVYLYGSGSVTTNNWYMNKDTSFSFTLTGSSAQYAEFLVGATSTTQKIYFQPTGSTTAKLNISMVPVTSGASTIGPKSVIMRSSNYDSTSFNTFKSGALYAVKVTLDSTADQSKTYTGVIKVSGTDF